MEVVYARQEHGSHPIYRNGDHIEVEWPVIGRKSYPNARKTLLAVVNNDPFLKKLKPKDLHYSWDRYFRTGKYSKRHQLKMDTLSLFVDSITVSKTPEHKQDLSLSVLVEEPVLGIDLDKRGIEVRKLFYAGFASKAIAKGYDPEDVLQELYKGLLVRNTGKCPFNPNKSSFGHYVYMVAGCILSNYNRRYSRLQRNEVFGVKDRDGEVVDVAMSSLAQEKPFEDSEYETEDLKRHLKSEILKKAGENKINLERACPVIDMMFEGYKNKEIIEETGFSANWVSKFLKFARKVVREIMG